ncbi:glycosyltransferase family 2 protein [Rhodohalobacter sp. 8-1]|uniref:glycosyltransferase family 2 protein n=1 Tax=Rhodohalobacter sp. 8-1 TaxID=3131972 RepID=UPI0030EBC572
MNRKRPLVSIIIPTYNRPELLRRAIKSALDQTYPNIEVIVVDDHSDNDLEQLQKEFPTVSFFRNSENRGGCFSRNRGIEKSTGEFINLLDDDDELMSEKIELQVMKFDDSSVANLGFVTAHVDDVRSGKKLIKRNEVKGDIHRQLLAGYAVSGIESLLIKKDALLEIEGFDNKLQSSQEYDLMIRLSEKYNVDYVDQILSRENRSTDQISLNFDKKIQGAKYLFKKHDKRYREIGPLFRAKMRLKLYGLICRFLVGKVLGEKAYRYTIKY